MDLVQRELTKLAAAAVIVDEISKAAQAREMEKQAKMHPGVAALITALSVLGLGGAAAGGAYAMDQGYLGGDRSGAEFSLGRNEDGGVTGEFTRRY